MAIEEIIRTKTGIQGLDKALNGGFPTGNTVLIAGGAGTGKSTFCLQYTINGAALFGERGLYISTEQNRTELYKQAAGFNWRLEDLEQRNLVKIVFIDIDAGDNFRTKLDSLVSEFKPKRMVIDSLTTLTDSLMVAGMTDDKGFSLVQIAETVNPIPRTEQILNKSILYKLFKEIKKYGLTTLLTTELPEDQKTLSADGVSEFIADGVICLKSMTVGDSSNRNLEIKKMRYTPIDGGLKSYELSQEGVTLV
ncbi:MAG: ATPase domain-containing protein [Sphaerochaetaceae bacterium]|nr:ATPase domain-containing protein [Sphaerochaetaceae bacterium]